MKKTIVMALAFCAVIATACSSNNGKITEGDTSKLDTLSYCVGADMGLTLNYQFAGLDLNVEKIKDGIKGGLLENADVTTDAALDILQEFFTKTIRERQDEFEAKHATDTTLVFVPFVSEEEKNEVSYAMGVNAGDGVRQSDMPIQYYWMFQAIDDAYGDKLVLDQRQMSEYMQNYFYVVRPAEAKARSEAWLAEKEKESGVKKTESGLLYKVIEAGDMSKAATKDADVVSVYYVGKLNNGKVFDASRFADRDESQKKMMRKQMPSLFDEEGNPLKADEPIEFPLNGVIKGWTEGMKLVGPGGKIVLYIPSDLAYGVQGAGNAIGPNEALEFTVELLEVKPAVEEAVEEAPATM